jgi:hypothetical protein
MRRACGVAWAALGLVVACGGSSHTGAASDASTPDATSTDSGARADAGNPGTHHDAGRSHDAGAAHDASAGDVGVLADSGRADGGGLDGASDAHQADAHTDAHTPVDAGEPANTCTNYCTDILANCTGTSAQFPDLASCMAVCANYPTGLVVAPTGQDSLACRLYYANLAKTQPDVCPNAGPTGGDLSPTGTGSCGEPCAAFCAVALVTCANKPNAYASLAACMAECAMFPADTAPYGIDDSSNDDMGCRFTELSIAAENAVEATSHCTLIRFTSAVCTM